MASRSLFSRMLLNVAWLIGGKGFGAVCSLVYLAVLTRSLGLKGFGHFALIFGTSQALIAIAGFQTWRVVVRYGADHVHRQNWDAFGRLSMLAGALDAVGAVLGCLIAYVVFFHFSDTLDLNPELIETAFWFNIAAVWALVSAPTGIVRALDRFDVGIYVEAIVPVLRLLAAIAIWLTGPSLVRFLIAWAVIDLIEAAVYWVMARRLCPAAIRFRNLRLWRLAFAENKGVGRFFWVTYAGATLDALMKQGPLLAVGFLVGTSAAGLYRLAQQLAQGLGKLSNLLTRAVYAEIARARAAATAAEFKALTVRTTAIAAAGGLVVVIFVLSFGRVLMETLGGDAFAGGGPILVALSIAASFELASVAFEPFLHASARADLSLLAHFTAVTVAAAGLVLLAPVHGAVGAGWGVAGGSATLFLVMGFFALYVMRDESRQGQSISH